MLHALALAAALLAPQGANKPLPVGTADNPELTAMSDSLNKLYNEKKYHEANKASKKNREKLVALIAEDKLTTGSDFLKTAQLLQNSQWYEEVRLAHEAALMAVLLKAPKAMDTAGRTWDALLISLGRKQRLGTLLSPPSHDPDGRYTADWAPKGVIAVLTKPAEASEAAKSAQDNKELAELRKLDQAAREGPMASISEEQLIKMMADDSARQKKAIAMLESGEVKTGKDFEAAALILQHSSVPDGYALAHECAIASVLLGYDEAAWLISRTYDRYLVSLGHRQRYGTQWHQDGLVPMDPVGINDRMRLQVATYKLEDLKTKAAARAKELMGGGGSK